MIEKTWTANEKKTLNEFLRQKIPELLKGEISNSKIRRLIVSGAVYINSRQCRIPSFKINSGTAIKVLIDKEKFFFEKQWIFIRFIGTHNEYDKIDANSI